MQRLMSEVQRGQATNFIVGEDGVLRHGIRLCVPNVDDLRKEIMEEAHYAVYCTSWFHQDVS